MAKTVRGAKGAPLSCCHRFSDGITCCHSILRAAPFDFARYSVSENRTRRARKRDCAPADEAALAEPVSEANSA